MMKRLLICAAIFLFAFTNCDAQSSGGVHVVGGMTHQHTLAPGAQVEGSIQLRNISDEPRDVRIYQTDYSFSADGKNSYDEPGKLARSNAGWIELTPRHITIPPGESDSIYYSIQVPNDKKLSGTYWSVLMVEPTPPGALDLPEQKTGEVNIGIQTTMRYAIQVVANIGDTGKCELKFSNRRLLVGKDRRNLQVDIENSGERWLTPQIWTDVFDENGKSMGRLNGNRLRIYPGCSARFEIDLKSLPKGKYNALLVADNSDDNLFGTQCRFEIE